MDKRRNTFGIGFAIFVVIIGWAVWRAGFFG